MHLANGWPRNIKVIYEPYFINNFRSFMLTYTEVDIVFFEDCGELFSGGSNGKHPCALNWNRKGSWGDSWGSGGRRGDGVLLAIGGQRQEEEGGAQENTR